MHIIHGFSTVGKSTEQIVKELTGAGAALRLPLAANSVLRVGSSPITGISPEKILNCEGEQQLISII